MRRKTSQWVTSREKKRNLQTNSRIQPKMKKMLQMVLGWFLFFKIHHVLCHCACTFSSLQVLNSSENVAANLQSNIYLLIWKMENSKIFVKLKDSYQLSRFFLQRKCLHFIFLLNIKIYIIRIKYNLEHKTRFNNSV